MDYIPLPNEELFYPTPIGVRYICEFCHKGEMKIVGDQALTVGQKLFEHRCTACGKTMHLPKSYPYIEWIIPEKGND